MPKSTLTVTLASTLIPAGTVTTALTLRYFSCRALATRLRLAVGAPALGSGGAFWLAPGAGGIPGPRTPGAAVDDAVTAAASGAAPVRPVGGPGRASSSTPATATATAV